MKNLRVLALLLFVSLAVKGQQTEYSLTVGSGIFSYSGAGAASTTGIVYGIIMPHAYTADPYGRKSDFPITLETQVIHHTKSNLLFGLELGYQFLNTRIPITKGYYNPEVMIIGENLIYDASGYSQLKNQYISIHPVIGRRFPINKEINLDLLAGCDFAFCVGSIEKDYANVPTTGSIIEIEFQKAHPSVDCRPGILLKGGYKRSAIQLGYSMGLTGYQSPGSGRAYSRFLSIAYSFRIL